METAHFTQQLMSKICSLTRLPEGLQGICLGNFLVMKIQITKKEHPTSFHSRDNLRKTNNYRHEAKPTDGVSYIQNKTKFYKQSP